MQNLLKSSMTKPTVVETDKGWNIKGYASTYNDAEPDSYGDRIAPGAYDKYLSERDFALPILWQHNGAEVIGKWESAVSDEKGLFVEGILFKGIQKAEETAVLIMNGGIETLSVGYQLNKYEETSEGEYLLQEMDLHEVSIVSTPANSNARLKSKHTLARKATSDEPFNIKEFELFLREAGLSRKGAKAQISMFKSELRNQIKSELQVEDEREAHNKSLKDALQNLTKR